MQIDRVIGEGSESVYMYYNPNERKLAILEGFDVWECKIGFTRSTDVDIRILEQFPHTVMAKEPVVGLVIQCEDAADLERKIHKAFRTAKVATNGLGCEWFLTNPMVVEKFWLDNINPATAKFGFNECTIQSYNDLGLVLENQRKYMGFRQQDMTDFCTVASYKRAVRTGKISTPALFAVLEGLGLELVLRSKTRITLDDLKISTIRRVHTNR